MSQNVQTDHTPMPLQSLLLSFRGRIGRSDLWLRGYLVCAAASLAINTAILVGVWSNGYMPGWLYPLSLLLLWPWLAMWAKRLHDLGQSGWQLLLMLIPIVGTVFTIWIAAKVLFLRGMAQSNRFGPPPATPAFTPAGRNARIVILVLITAVNLGVWFLPVTVDTELPIEVRMAKPDDSSSIQALLAVPLYDPHESETLPLDISRLAVPLNDPHESETLPVYISRLAESSEVTIERFVALADQQAAPATERLEDRQKVASTSSADTVERSMLLRPTHELLIHSGIGPLQSFIDGLTKLPSHVVVFDIEIRRDNNSTEKLLAKFVLHLSTGEPQTDQ